MVTVDTGEDCITFMSVENPSTDYVKLSTSEASLFDKGIIVGQTFEVNSDGHVTSIHLLPLSSAQISALPVGRMFVDAADGHFKFKLSGGINNITG